MIEDDNWNGWLKMEVLGNINDITINKETDSATKIKIRVVKSEDDDTIIDKIEIHVDKDGKLEIV